MNTDDKYLVVMVPYTYSKEVNLTIVNGDECMVIKPGKILC